MRKKIAAFFCFGGIAILLAVFYVIFKDLYFARFIGMISIIMSILLSVVAVLYTYFSGKKTLGLLEKIEEKNNKLIDKINQDLLKGAYDEEGLKTVRKNWPSPS